MNYKNVFGGKMQISEKKLENILKNHPFEKEGEKPKQVEKSSTKKRKLINLSFQP